VLLGTSGCGKTTTLKMINRLIEPDSGEIYINGQHVLQRDPEVLRRNIGYVIQERGLFPHYTVAQNIGIVPGLLKWPKQKTQHRTWELLELLKMPPDDFLNKYPHELSGGQQQRVSVARALAADPEVILMDEPFGALDPITRLEIRKEFRSLEKLLQKTIVLVTHDVFEAFELGDRICAMNEGRMEQVGAPRELIFRPASDFVAQFFEESRMQLEMKAVKIGELLPNVKTKPAEVVAGQLTVTTRSNLLRLFELTARAKDWEGVILIEDKKHGTIVKASWAALFEAFFEMKREGNPT